MSGSVPMYSTVTGALADTAELDAGYWFRNLRQSVVFEQTTQTLIDDGFSVWVEISPHPVLVTPIQDTVEARHGGVTDQCLVIGTLRREQGGMDSAAVVLRHVAGDRVDPARTFRDLGFDSVTSVELRNRLQTATGLSLPASLLFDYPTATRVAQHLAEQFGETPRARQRLVELELDARDPLAIVGMACRFPGGVNSPQDLWELVAAGRDAISPFPTDRGWNLEDLYDPHQTRPGVSVACEGGFLEGAGDFDAAFFGISPREALTIDPQQRLLLEASWEALEHAGIDPHTLAGTPTGVFIGSYSSGYGEAAATLDNAHGQLLTGAAQSVISGRVAYTLGLQGPAVTIDTACSSSLVACEPGKANWHWSAASPSWPPPNSSSNSPTNTDWPPTAAARPSPTPPTAPPGPKASVSSCWNGSPTHAATDTTSGRSYAPAPSTKTAPPTG
jgi:acyl carrier protein